MTLPTEKWIVPDDSNNENVKYEIIPYVEKPILKKSPLVWKFPSLPKKDEYYDLVAHREPVVTYCITPNNAPEEQFDPFDNRIGRGNKRSRGFTSPYKKEHNSSELLLTTIHGLFKKFYLPHRVRINKDGVKVKLNDVVSYKIAIIDGVMKFYLTVPKKWSNSFMSAVRQDWGQVDITKVDNEIIEFDVNRTQAMELHMRHHYALSFKHGNEQVDDMFMSSLSSLAATLGEGDKLLIDYNIEPIGETWKARANKKLREFKKGAMPTREDTLSMGGMIARLFATINTVFDEFTGMIEEIMQVDKKKKEEEEALFDLKYSNEKIRANTKGYKMQIRVLGQSNEIKKVEHAFSNVENSFSLLDGDNSFKAKRMKTQGSRIKVINAVKKNVPLPMRTPDIYFEKEMENIVRLPKKETLKEFTSVIEQDGFTRSEIDKDFLEDTAGAIPFGYTLDKEPKKLYLGGYNRNDWTEKGRYVKDKQKLDDRSTSTMVFGGMGSGKTSYSENQALFTFGAHIEDYEQWKRESKSCVVFDVADGDMIKNIYKRIPEHLLDRVVILNHSNINNPISVNNADLDEFNTEIMKDEDYSYTMAEMESKLVLEILQSKETFSMDRWFTAALQAVHEVNKDWGYIEAMRVLTDDLFRQEQVMPFIRNKRLSLDIKAFNRMAASNSADKIIETIQNRFSQLERDQKLWDCIAQKPIRDENGKVKLNFRKLMDGDEGGAYLVLIYIPKSGISKMHRKFIFAQYFTKIWNVTMSREVGFAGREYRPETLVIMDEIHQIIDIPIVAKLFIEIFKEPRKYSVKYLFTLHGWSSLARAGRGLEGDIKQSIMDNGCNLIMLKGGDEAFNSLSNFFNGMTQADFQNLMNMKWCGIMALRWGNKNHVMQVRLLEHIGSEKSVFKTHRNIDSSFLMTYASEYGRSKDIVRDDNLERGMQLIEDALVSENQQINKKDLDDIGDMGMED